MCHTGSQAGTQKGRQIKYRFSHGLCSWGEMKCLRGGGLGEKTCKLHIIFRRKEGLWKVVEDEDGEVGWAYEERAS